MLPFRHWYNHGKLFNARKKIETGDNFNIFFVLIIY